MGVPWRVFLSNTSELREFPAGRSFVAAAEAAVIRAGGAVTDMGHCTTRDSKPAGYCQDQVRRCDVYVGLIGLRYGSPVRDQPQVSYAQLEFDTATGAGIPRLMFLLDEDAAVPIPPGRQDPELWERQLNFRARVLASGVMTATFATPEQLEVLLLQALHDLRDSKEVLEIAEELSRKVNMVEIGEFQWQDSHYDQDSAVGRELLYLISNHEWVRATSEAIDISRSDVIETTIKTDIDLGQITHEAFRQRSGRIWLPVAVLPPLSRNRHLEPDPFTTVTDASGNLLPLMTTEDLGHRVSAALAEIIVNMAIAHVGNIGEVRSEKDEGQWHGAQSRAGTRDQRVLLAAAIYRMLRSEVALKPDQDDPAPAASAISDVARELLAFFRPPAHDADTEPTSEQNPEPSPTRLESALATPRIRMAREWLLAIFKPYIDDLEMKAERKEPSNQFVPELAERAIKVLQAMMQSMIAVVPLDYDIAPTVLTVRVPTRIIRPTSTTVKLRKPRTWLIRPSAHLDVDILLPTADADRQIQIRLADGMSFEGSGDGSTSARSFLARLDIEVTKPPTLDDLSACLAQISHERVTSWPTSLAQSLVDLTRVKASAASDTLRHYAVIPRGAPEGQASKEADSNAGKPASVLQPLNEELRKLAASHIPKATLSAGLGRLRAIWQDIQLDSACLSRRAQVERLGPRTVVARVQMIEDVAQRATSKSARVSVDVRLDDRDYFSIARASALMSLILMTGVFAYLAGWHVVRDKAAPAPEVLAIVLTLFVTLQASRIEQPDRSTLRGQLSAIANWLVAASMLPAIALALALAFKPSGWDAIYWAAGCTAAQFALLELMMTGPLVPSASPRREDGDEFRIGQRRKFETEQLDYQHFEALYSGYWRNTTAEALTVGRMAYGYIVRQAADGPSGSDSQSPQLQTLLSPHRGSVTSDESNNLLALLHSSTERQAITFAVFREKPGKEWANDPDVKKIEDLHLDPDRLAPMDNVDSTVDIFVGVHLDQKLAVDAHPLIAVIMEAKSRLIVLEAQLPVPVQIAEYDGLRWARARLALRDIKDIGRLTQFLDSVYKTTVLGHDNEYVIAVQAAPTVEPRIIEPPSIHDGQSGLCAGSKISASENKIPARSVKTQSKSTYVNFSHMRAIVADARSNVESIILQLLAPDCSRSELAHLNYATLHGKAVCIALTHEMGDYHGSNQADGEHSGRRPVHGTFDSTVRRATETGQVRIVVDERVAREQLGSMSLHPLLRVRFWWQDRPGVVLNVLNSIDGYLHEPSAWRSNVPYARVQIASGRVALWFHDDPHEFISTAAAWVE
jgi:Domain of unknown function (DUF4062)